MNDKAWEPMETVPRDGTRIDVLCKSAGGASVVAADLYYGKAPMGGDIVLRGNQNVLSPYLTPKAWRPR